MVTSFTRRLLLWSSLALLAFGAVACGADVGDAPPLDRSETDAAFATSQATVSSSGPCDDGVVEECTIYVNSASGTQQCFPGLKVCDEGRFTRCLDPADVEHVLEQLDHAAPSVQH